MQHAQPQRTILMTGATGAVGRYLLAWILQSTNWEVFCIVRAAGGDAHALARIDEVLEAGLVCDVSSVRGRVHAFAGDLEHERLGLGLWQRGALASVVTDVIHVGGDVSFTMTHQEAEDRNVRGTFRALELARVLPQLQRFIHISTAYVAGNVTGRVREADPAVRGSHRNTYESSKLSAEARVVNAGVPYTILRPTIVTGSWWSGYTAGFKVIYPPLRFLAQGGLRMIPGYAGALLDLVPVDYVAAAIVASVEDPTFLGRTLHLAMGHRAITLGELVSLAADVLGKPAPEIVAPTDIEARMAGGTVSADDAKMLETILAHYGTYLVGSPSYATGPSDGLLRSHGIEPPPRTEHHLHHSVAYAEASEWGRKPVPARIWAERLGLSRV